MAANDPEVIDANTKLGLTMQYRGVDELFATNKAFEETSIGAYAAGPRPENRAAPVDERLGNLVRKLLAKVVAHDYEDAVVSA